MGKFENKWMRAVIPALLIHCSIGTVYCWSLFKGDIASYIGKPVSEVEWAFSIAIFVLGMSAAFGGKFVEKDIHKSSLLAAIFFVVGMAATGFFIYQKSLIGIYISYGVVMGIGLGIGYLTPVKTLMLWFKEQKGLATGLAVAGFGLAKVIASPLMEKLLGDRNSEGILVNPTNIYTMFYILAAIYLVMMVVGHLILKKPAGYEEESLQMQSFSYRKVLTNKTFIGIWLMFYINITCGLALISQEKGILSFIGFGAIGLVSSLTAIFNAGGRIAFSSWGDRLKDRNSIYKIIFISSIVIILCTVIFDGINNSMAILIIALLCIVNAGYGGGFSSLPPLLSDRFGIDSISTVHGLALSAWAFAGLTGNQLSAIILEKTQSYDMVLYVIAALFTLATLISIFVVKPEKVNLENEEFNKKKEIVIG
ncbi:Inner membrane protein yhjX [Solibacillus isronensis B3W22]|uniref:Permease of the major facilitator superfamily n=2 Tax=Solibacillus TaxID=648800 RepID=F2F372_SOLSS|nr:MULTISPECIES: OFA family MFS transporter [Solibacillus]AMO87379.1 transporter [Solibacillus silvestris]EKB44713.1 Inner membrane protein yhjX [Solibacillus isronensis B3W22]BAK14575.1 permease of the major facilitator superfamily [Solibacillus silvestris StLB046]